MASLLLKSTKGALLAIAYLALSGLVSSVVTLAESLRQYPQKRRLGECEGYKLYPYKFWGLQPGIRTAPDGSAQIRYFTARERMAIARIKQQALARMSLIATLIGVAKKR